MSHEPSFRISFLGGASAIGASAALVEVAGTTLLVDCGVRLGRVAALPDLSPLSGKRLDAILLTHAHSDHGGALPAVCDLFPSAPVYATPPTIEITTILLRDALKLMQSGERDDELPLYSALQVERALDAFFPVQHGASFTVGAVTVSYIPAGHILGASMIHLATPAGTILFTGDFSVSSQRTVPALSRPALTADLVITEATYGARLHEDRHTAEERLLTQLGEALTGDGRVLIPAFAVGRAQEVLLLLKHALRSGRLPRVPVFVDGMVRAVCDVYRRHERYVSRALLHELRRADHPFYTADIRPIRDLADRRAALALRPSVIVASSGMLAGGASVFYAAELASHANDEILLTGYQDEESPGRALLALSGAEGKRELRLGERTVEVACRVSQYGLSAHADRMQIAAFVEALRPRCVALVHGNALAKQSLARALSCPDIICPEDGASLERSYPRRSTAPAVRRLVRELDVDRARHLVGPPGDAAIRARKVAEAWLGERVTAAEVDQVASRLEELGIARRDDNRRQLLWVLTPHESGLDPEEASLEEALRRENPKGKLLELCMRLRQSAPETSFAVEGAYHVAELSLVYRGEALSSGRARAAVKKTAEQLAARALLAVLTSREAPEGAHAVNDERANELRHENPKGRLLEACVAQRLPTPTFEQRVVEGGYALRGQLANGAQLVMTSAWYRASTLKAAEQAAAAELLRALHDVNFTPADSAQPIGEAATSPEQVEEVGLTREPRMLLNELRQVGLLLDFGYTHLATQGPSHQPVFNVVGWATAKGTTRIETAPVLAPSKKDAQREAAAALVRLLVEAGMTR